VYLDAYWIDKTEVTNTMYARCVQAGVCDAPSSKGSNYSDSYYGSSQYADHPVVYVDWFQAQAYCEWAGRRLPTEAQWEKAARGADGRTYPWGEQEPNCDLANYDGTKWCIGDTSAVGSYPSGASPYGALDMAGNVWEWAADWYSSSYYSQSPGNNPTGPSSGEYRVIRGGSYGRDERELRSAYRGDDDPNDESSSLVGLRCASSEY